MPFERWGYMFRGPYDSCESLQEIAGICVVLCNKDGEWEVLDVDESDNVQQSIKKKQSSGSWAAGCTGTIYYAAIYTADKQPAERKELQQKIRSLSLEK